MAKAKKDDGFSSLKSIVTGYVGGLERDILKRVVGYAITAVFAIMGLVFVSLGLKGFLSMYMPNYVADIAMGAALLYLGSKIWRR